MRDAGQCVRPGFAAALVLAAAFVIGTPAAAATIGINGTVLTAAADGGDDVLVGVVSGSDMEFLGISFTVVTPGCTNAFGATRCSLIGLTEVRIDMAGGDDVLDLSGIGAIAMPAGMPPLEFLALGGADDDVLLGSAGNVNRFWGGTGDDVLLGAAGGAYCLDGGAGDNIAILNGGTQASGCGGPEPVFPPAQPVQVPEPHGLALLLSALGIAGLARRGRTDAAAPRPPVTV